MSYLRPNKHRPLHKAAEFYLVPGVLTLFFAVLKTFENVIADKILPVSDADVVEKFPPDSFLVIKRGWDNREQVEQIEP